jgi:tripartite-type tricarboxylate transporter receptor subunit TctC
MWAPKGTPKENIDKIFNAYKRAAEESGDEIKKALMAANIRLNLLSPEELRQYTQARIPVLKKCVEEMGIK